MFSIIYSEEFLKHDTGLYHPETPGRLSAIVEALKATSWSDHLQWFLPTPAWEKNAFSWVSKFHHREYIHYLKNLAEQGGGMLDPDTPVSPQSYDIALLAVSAWLDGIDHVLERNNPAFALVRPPGHHATKKMGMGFCLFSNAAIAAHYALEKPGINRVAILDWDVHHGNGTEDIVQGNPHIVYCSVHQFPCYPGTGRASDRGHYENVLNIPLPPGSTLKEYQVMFEGKIIPFLKKFQPDLLLVSAGYDANHDDPLAMMSLQPSDYGIFSRYLLGVTRRILFGLEGGYNLEVMSQSVVATVEPFMMI
ncbi:histone deacetylase superfamily [Gloeothece citriformis PCC 7424]|uniref:Histone deacetylase superfamily n=1 Tax=Gloeothece citriformis (strain PCC 7424) TaxID=65393 RepID=B7KGK0_GLOC7|nr:histone deacetylase [Gloeothece citriformis]ACK71927.1 histone deacetylase superfamily [Gloeothece citriformis PCC 7424]